MEIKLLNDIGSNKVSVRQNSSGFWYCDQLELNCISIIDGIALMGRAIDDMIKTLENKNKNVKK